MGDKNESWAAHCFQEKIAELEADNARLQREIDALRHVPAEGECTCPQHGNWINAEDVNRAARAIDVAMNGEQGAARQALLIDLVGQAENTWRLLHMLAMALATVAIGSNYGHLLPVDIAVMVRNTLDLYYHRYPNQRIGKKYTTEQMAEILKQMEAFKF